MKDEWAVFHVVHDTESDDWKVEREGSVRALMWAKNKVAAVSAATTYGRAFASVKVVIHAEDGSIEAEHTYEAAARKKPA
jgi:hypothetical protein